MTQIKPHQIAVVSDLHQYGRRFDDGQPVIGERFFIQYEDDRGYRWRHYTYFDGVEVTGHDCEEGPYFVDIKRKAEERAYRLHSRIEFARQINLEYWTSERPAYGSPAWIESHQDEEEILRERMEDGHGTL